MKLFIFAIHAAINVFLILSVCFSDQGLIHRAFTGFTDRWKQIIPSMYVLFVIHVTIHVPLILSLCFSDQGLIHGAFTGFRKRQKQIIPSTGMYVVFVTTSLAKEVMFGKGGYVFGSVG